MPVLPKICNLTWCTVLCLTICVISRWTIKQSRYELQDSVESKSSQLRHIYKRAIILLRTLYSFVRMMPAYQVQSVSDNAHRSYKNKLWTVTLSLECSCSFNLCGECRPFHIANVIEPSILTHIASFSMGTNFSWTLSSASKEMKGWMRVFFCISIFS